MGSLRYVLGCIFVAWALVAGCSADQPESVTCPANICGIDASTDIASTDVLRGYDIVPIATLQSVSLSPLTPAVHTTLGMAQTLNLQASGTLTDGTHVPLSGNWSVPDGSISTIDPTTGILTANGLGGGDVTVSFSTVLYGGGASTITATVWLTADVAPAAGMLGANGPTVFGMTPRTPPDPSGSAQLVYPLDGVVFPQNITAPLVQWSGPGTAGDLYRVVYTRPHVTISQYVAYTDASFTFSAALPDAAWTSLANSDPGSTASVSVDHLDATQSLVFGSNSASMHFAPGSVSGSVYYWSMGQGQLHRVPGGTVNNEQLFPSGIVGTADTAPSYTYSGCIACHQISRDGRYLIANGDSAYVFDLTTYDPTTANVPVRVLPGFRWYFATMSPDDTRVFGTMPDTSSAYVDPMTMGLVPASGSPLPSTGVAHPNWSPDGHTIAVISNVSGWTSNASFTGGDLTLIPVTGPDAFGPANVIHHGADLAMSDPAGGTADAFPSWTPDDRYLVFAHTSNTRAAGTTHAPGSLYITPPTAGATPVRMALATDDGTNARAHYPNISPFISGGYYWIVFYSDRDYGNAQAGSAGSGRPQLWVSAISQSFDGTTDPSQIPYWLPGQDVTQQNADAVWAASACRMTGDTCRVATDCCAGACVPSEDGGFMCATASQCRREGESCEQTSDCCGMGTLTCDPQIHVCQQPIG